MTKEVAMVSLMCKNPMERYVIRFPTIESAEKEIEERQGWGELQKVVIRYSDDTTKSIKYDAWGS